VTGEKQVSNPAALPYEKRLTFKCICITFRTLVQFGDLRPLDPKPTKVGGEDYKWQAIETVLPDRYNPGQFLAGDGASIVRMYANHTVETLDGKYVHFSHR